MIGSCCQKTKGRKRHILAYTLGIFLKAEVLLAGLQDRNGEALVFDKLTNRFPHIEKICDDGGYLGPKDEVASPRPMNIIIRNQVDFQVLPKRWIVELMLAWPGLNRRLARTSSGFQQQA